MKNSPSNGLPNSFPSCVPLLSADDLIEKMKAYDDDVQEDLIRQAYAFSMKAHEKQKRASGEPYFIHPVAVAELLISMHLDSASIVTGLLHDTVEDTLTTLEEIRLLFGKDIAFLVDGVTKLTHVEELSEQAKQTEQFRKLLLAMSSDIRVLLVKLCDRLHNMRTLQFVPSEERRKRIALETLDIYAPLAERMGLKRLQEELEDLAFAALNPDARLCLLSRLKFLRAQDGDFVNIVCRDLTTLVQEKNVQALVFGREKAPYSIWRKMQRKNLLFEQLFDIMAFRILVDDIPTCYQVLGILHSHYAIIPGRFKDYISLPRKTHYRSLHTTLIGPLQRRIEVQIRTHDMDRLAELGIAAHWQYKQGFGTEHHQYQWIRELLDMLEHAHNAEEFLEHTKLEMFPDQVFCFTPKGKLITLPRGSTPIDFGYAVHSSIGNTCVGSKINGRMVPLRTPLNSGDQVEILTSNLQNPLPEWEHVVVTAKARSHIRRFIRHQLHQEEHTHQEAHSPQEEAPPSHLHNTHTTSAMNTRSGKTGVPASENSLPPDPCLKIAHVNLSDIQGAEPGLEIRYASCCHPLPGDPLVGVKNGSQELIVHRKECTHLTSSIAPENMIDVSWRINTRKGKYPARLNVVFVNQPGSLTTLTNLLAKADANILALKIRERSQDFVEFFVDIEVLNVHQLKEIIGSLRMSSWILSVERWHDKNP